LFKSKAVSRQSGIGIAESESVRRRTFLFRVKAIRRRRINRSDGKAIGTGNYTLSISKIKIQTRWRIPLIGEAGLDEKESVRSDNKTQLDSSKSTMN